MHIASHWHLGKRICHIFSSCTRGEIQRELAGPTEDKPIQYTCMDLSLACPMPEEREKRFCECPTKYSHFLLLLLLLLFLGCSVSHCRAHHSFLM